MSRSVASDGPAHDDHVLWIEAERALLFVALTRELHHRFHKLTVDRRIGLPLLQIRAEAVIQFLYFC